MASFTPATALQLAAKARHQLDGGLLTQVFGIGRDRRRFGPRQDVLQAASGKRAHGLIDGHGMAERGHELRQGRASQVLGIRPARRRSRR